MDGLTPNTISILLLISHYVRTCSQCKKFLQFLLDEVTNTKLYSHIEKSLAQLIDAIRKAGISSSVPDVLTQSLNAIDDPDKLIDFFDDVSDISVKSTIRHGNRGGVVENSSIFGVYIRSKVLLFKELMFSAISRLFEQLQAYNDLRSNFQVSIEKTALQTFLHKKASEIETHIGRTSYAETAEMIQELKKMSPSSDLPQAHFLSYLNCLHHRELEGALDSLHCYFDYCGPKIQRNSNSDAKSSETSAKATQQYAILNLGILHFFFGHEDLCVLAIEETVRIAQQNNDHACLMHALTLLCRLAQEKASKGNSLHIQQLLERCLNTQASAVAKAKRDKEAWNIDDESKERKAPPPLPIVPLVEAQSWLAMAKFQLLHIQDGKLAKDPWRVWLSLQKANNLNHSHYLKPMMSSHHLLKSTAWKLYGSKQLSRVWSDMQLRFFGSTAPSRDSALALCNLAADESPQGIGEVNRFVAFGKKRYPYSGHIGFEERSLITEFKRVLRRNDLDTAKAIGRRIFSLSCIGNNVSSSIAVMEASFVEVQLKFHSGQYVEAAEQCWNLVRMATQRNRPIQSIKFLLFIARIHQAAGNSLTALPYILHCLSLCEILHLDSTYAEVSIRLSELHLVLGSPVQAQKAIQKVLPQIMEHCQTTAVVDTYITLAKCRIALYDHDSKENDSEQVLWEAIEYLGHARKLCKETHYYTKAREVYYLQARVFHQLGFISERNEAACMLQSLNQTTT